MALHNITGKSGEDAAVNFLQNQKYKILSRNFKSKVGEVDIVAKERDQVVFVEVKTRSNTLFGTPGEAIGYKKLISLIKTAQYYLMINNFSQNYRIDAVEVIMVDGQVKSINQIKNITL